MIENEFRDEVRRLVRMVAFEYAEEVHASFDLEGEPDEEGGTSLMTPCATIHLELRGGIEYEVHVGIRKGKIVIIGDDDSEIYLTTTLESIYAYLMLEANNRLLLASQAAQAQA